MSFSLRLLMLVGIVLFIDWYFFQAVSTVFKNLTGTKRTALNVAYWSLTAFSVTLALTPFVYPWAQWSKFAKVYLVSFVLIMAISKIVGLVFLFLDDGIRVVRWIASYIIKPSSNAVSGVSLEPLENVHKISRLEFLNQIALIAAAVPFVSFLYGMVRGAYQYTVHRVDVALPNLPVGFHGLKIVQISDLHVGSFNSPEPLEKAIAIVNAQKPDVIFFTGDLVNNEASETNGLLDTLRKIQAPMGVFSTIGNHDYGDYISWDSPDAKRTNFERLKAVHGELGWRLLMNEHVALEKNGDTIALIGVENWSASMSFPKRGNLSQAIAGSESHPVKILLSHDPTHWDAQVRKDFQDVDITFSGHTHGAQFGIEIPGFRWSPVQYVYKQWAGLYQSGKQYLYVNRGLGFLGYPGRVGISPEITVMTLNKA